MQLNRKHLYNDYGAHAMKSSYQRNMGIGLLTVILLVAAVTGLGWLVIPEADAEIPPIDPPQDSIIVEWIQPPPIYRDPPDFGAGEKPKPTSSVGIPVPIPDEELEDDTTVIASRTELAAIVGVDDLTSGSGQLPNFDGGDGNYLPSPDTFIALEIYPEMIFEQLPEYPRLARQAGLEGILWVEVLIDEEGNVIDAIVGKSSGVISLDNAAVKAAYKNKFQPGIQNGRPIKVWVTYKVDFSLTGD